MIYSWRFALRLIGFTLLVTRCLPASVSVTLTSNPVGRVFAISGSGCPVGGYATPQTLSWSTGANCTVVFVSPQSAEIGTQYLFTSWQDGSTTNPRTIAAPGQATTYTANFKIQYLVTIIANPLEGGTVSGGGWYDANTTVTLLENAAKNYRFAGWSSGSATVNVASPLTIIANFALSSLGAPLGHYDVVTIMSRAIWLGQGKGINNYGQVIGAGNDANAVPLLWTPVIANAEVGSIIALAAPNFPVTVTSLKAINDRGQIAGQITSQISGQTTTILVLWSPSIPNGTSGTSVTLAGPTTNGWVTGLNNFGQVFGYSAPGGYFIWTPVTANASIGTMNTANELVGIGAMNDYGQATISANPQPLLFTPSVPNGSKGTFTPFLDTSYGPLAINKNGMVLGTHNQEAFLWVPNSPNGSTGTVTVIPLPAGYDATAPVDLNANGQFVGVLGKAVGGTTTPFLYSGGTFYDLTLLNSDFSYLNGINDAGQIAITGRGSIYLLTPPPMQVSSTHVGNFVQGQSIATYTLSVENAATTATSGAVSVTDTLPTGLTASAINGPGWGCSLGSLTCSRSDALAAGGTYPPITLTVSVASGVGSPLINSVNASNGGLTALASDSTTIIPAFTDVFASSPGGFLPFIDLLQESGITKGCQSSPPMYCPNDNIPESQMAVFVIRSANGDDNFTNTQTPYFTDVPATNLYFPWIQKMQDLGIGVPCTTTQYCPDSAVTRGIMAV